MSRTESIPSSISAPTDCQRLVHVEWDPELQVFTGLPEEWRAALPQISNPQVTSLASRRDTRLSPMATETSADPLAELLDFPLSHRRRRSSADMIVTPPSEFVLTDLPDRSMSSTPSRPTSPHLAQAAPASSIPAPITLSLSTPSSSSSSSEDVVAAPYQRRRPSFMPHMSALDYLKHLGFDDLTTPYPIDVLHRALLSRLQLPSASPFSAASLATSGILTPLGQSTNTATSTFSPTSANPASMGSTTMMATSMTSAHMMATMMPVRRPGRLALPLRLPLEMLKWVLSCLDAHSLAAVARTCADLHRAARDNRLWRPLAWRKADRLGLRLLDPFQPLRALETLAAPSELQMLTALPASQQHLFLYHRHLESLDRRPAPSRHQFDYARCYRALQWLQAAPPPKADFVWNVVVRGARRAGKSRLVQSLGEAVDVLRRLALASDLGLAPEALTDGAPLIMMTSSMTTTTASASASASASTSSTSPSAASFASSASASASASSTASSSSASLVAPSAVAAVASSSPLPSETVASPTSVSPPASPLALSPPIVFASNPLQSSQPLSPSASAASASTSSSSTSSSSSSSTTSPVLCPVPHLNLNLSTTGLSTSLSKERWRRRSMEALRAVHDDPVVDPLSGTFRLGLDLIYRRILVTGIHGADGAGIGSTTSSSSSSFSSSSSSSSSSFMSGGGSGSGGGGGAGSQPSVLKLQVWDDPNTDGAGTQNRMIHVQVYVVDVQDENGFASVQNVLNRYDFTSNNHCLGILFGNVRGGADSFSPRPRALSFDACKQFAHTRSLLYFEGDAASPLSVDASFGAMVAEVVNNLPFVGLRLMSAASGAGARDGARGGADVDNKLCAIM